MAAPVMNVLSEKFLKAALFKNQHGIPHDFQCCHWTFTWNNYSQEQMAYLDSDNFKEANKDITLLEFGEEVGESGTPHLQGYVVMNKKITFSGLKCKFDPINGKKSSICFRIMTSHYINSHLYCKKGEQPHIEWEKQHEKGPNFGKNAKFHQPLPYEPNNNKIVFDFSRIINEVTDGSSLLEIAELYPQHSLKYGSTLKIMIEEQKKINMIENFKKTYENFKPLYWQECAIEELMHEPNDRSIICWIDSKCGAGKSSLARYLCAMHGATMYSCTNEADVACAYNGERIIIFNFPKEQRMENICYGTIEKMKDGMIFSKKYNSSLKRFAPPHVVIFMNYTPDIKQMDETRWDIRDLTDPIYKVDYTVKLKDKKNTNVAMLKAMEPQADAILKEVVKARIEAQEPMSYEEAMMREHTSCVQFGDDQDPELIEAMQEQKKKCVQFLQEEHKQNRELARILSSLDLWKLEFPESDIQMKHLNLFTNKYARHVPIEILKKINIEFLDQYISELENRDDSIYEELYESIPEIYAIHDIIVDEDLTENDE